jgi:hypothetical protein
MLGAGAFGVAGGWGGLSLLAGSGVGEEWSGESSLIFSRKRGAAKRGMKEIRGSCLGWERRGLVRGTTVFRLRKKEMVLGRGERPVGWWRRRWGYGVEEKKSSRGGGDSGFWKR